MESMKALMLRYQRELPSMDASSQGYDPLALNRMKVEIYNASQGELKGYDCPKCKNRGDLMVLRDDGSFFVRECRCMAVRRCIRKMESSGLKDVMASYTFDKFLAKQPWQQTILSTARSYASDPRGWLLAFGQSGAGKTHLCTAVCRELLLGGREVVYMPWLEDSAMLKAMKLDSQERTDRIGRVKSAQYLYIDDLFKCPSGQEGRSGVTPGDVRLAFEILNYRYTKGLPTLISTELYPEELMAIDEAIAGRIMERSASHVLPIGRNMARNYRLRHAAVV